MDNLVYVFDLTSKELFPSLSTISFVDENRIVLRRQSQFVLDLANCEPRRSVIIIDGESCGTVYEDQTRAIAWIGADTVSWDMGKLLVGARGYNKVLPGARIKAFYGGPFEGGRQCICYVSNCLMQPKVDSIRTFKEYDKIPNDYHDFEEASVTFTWPMGRHGQMFRYRLLLATGRMPKYPLETNPLFSKINL